jgi:hypothetical protein
MSYRHRSSVGEVLQTLPGSIGHLTGKKKGELVEGWNPATRRNEYHHPTEWANLKHRATELPDGRLERALYEENFPALPGAKPTVPVDPKGKTPMKKVALGKDEDVNVLNTGWQVAAEARLRTERIATEKMRKELTSSVNGRKGKAKEGVKNNSGMASSLAGLLQKYPEMVEGGGLLSRIVSDPSKATLEHQGQHSIPVNPQGKPDPTQAIRTISEAAERLAKGKGEGDDGNYVLQFIGCFVDGLTEVNEGKPKAKEQFDLVWPEFMKAFKLKEEDKEKLLLRVSGYKEIAGGASDTLSGKGTRKGDTRGLNPEKEVRMPNDPRLKIDDDNALIKGDISGSMHSCLLAQELSESLMGGAGIKEEGDPVVVKDKDLINARAVDALALTAGGMQGSSDSVFHTAFEMINGMQAITGLPPVSQAMATEIMDRMTKGQSFTDAVEPFFSDDEMPWKE